jgi:putative DNA primase/helicase
VADAWQAIHQSNSPPRLLLFSGTLAQVVGTEGRDPRPQTPDADAIYSLLAEVADWVRLDRREGGLVPTFPSTDVARVVRARPDPRLPLLERVVTTPTFGRGGELIAVPGYHEDERLFLCLDRELEDLNVPLQPSPTDVEQAKHLLLKEVLGDFPFIDQADRAHAVAAILQPFVRGLIEGPTPLFVIEAPTPGAGKGLLSNVIAAIATGREAHSRTLADSEAEVRKMLTSELALGRALVLLDNHRQGRTLDSETLASVLTAVIWTDRLLGYSRMLDVPNASLWVVTGNNIALSREIARRSVRVRLDPNTERPWLRPAQALRHPDLVAWVKSHRRDLVQATLILAQAWIAKWRPNGATALGSFEGWSAVLGGILEAAEVPGFLTKLEELYAAADAES